MKVTLISHTTDPQRLIETCARISYESKNEPFDQKVNSEFIRKLIKNGHESPLEHASATFLIEGVSRACSHQIVRHRLASFSQRSDRYTSHLDRDGHDRYVALPDSISKNEALKSDIVSKIFIQADLAYYQLIDMGIPKEDARLILPQAEATSLYMTANFREWRHFLRLRLDRHAQWEIRAVAREILRHLCVDGMYDCFADIQAEFDSEASTKDMEPADDTRVFGYTSEEFGKPPKDARDDLLPKASLVQEIELPCTKGEFEAMPRDEVDRIIRDATCHIAYPVLRYRFKGE